MHKTTDSETNSIYTLTHTNSDRTAYFRQIPVNKQGFTLLHLPRNIRKEILKQLTIKEIIRLVDYLDPDDATDLLQKLSEQKRKKIINSLNEEHKTKITFLLKFAPDSAAGIMSLDYIEVEKKSKFGHVLKSVKRHEKKTGKFPAILVVEDGFLVGELLGHTFSFHRPNENIANHIKKISAIKYNVDEDEVLRVFNRNASNKIAVLDETNSIIGVIYSKDLARIFEKKQTEDLSNFAGVSNEESVYDTAISKVKHRYKWLILNLATAFLAASVVSLFQDTISAFILLAVYMPIIAGMAGNAGTQALAVMVRGIALNNVDIKTGLKVIRREIFAGLLNGIIIGIIVFIIALIFNHNLMLGVIVGISMITNLIVAGLFGSVIPLIMKKLGKDPATSAAIFITTATDMLGFFVFLGLAQLLL